MPSDLPFHKKDFAEIVGGLLEDAASGRGGRTALTDAAGGSVVRTLMEVFAREMAVCYEQLDLVYRSAYLDTASGASLNYVVALLGIQRRPPGHIEGQVTFSRSQPAPQDIHIPAGTLVAGRDQPQFATVAHAVLVQGERLVSVGVLSLEPGDGTVPADKLNTMPRPIAGVEGVSNAADLIPRQRAETDDELRQRARVQARSSDTGTVAALEQAVRSLGIQEVRVLEYPADPALLPGQIQVVVGDPDLAPALLEQVVDRIEQVRPAGIVVGSGPAPRVWVQVTAMLTLDADRPDRERRVIENKLAGELISYFSQLAVGEPVHEAKVRSILIGNDAVVGCDPGAGFEHLLEPFVREDGALKSKASRYLLTSGDLQVGPRERIGLLPAELPIRLTLQGPAPAVLLDIGLELVAGTDPASFANLTDRLRAAGKAMLIDAVKTGHIDYAPLADAIGRIVPAKQQAKLRLTVVHESDGRVVELSAAQAREPLAAREVPRVRNIPVSVRS